MLVLAFLVASCVMAIKPVSAATDDSWVSKAPMQQARAGLGVVVVNVKIYAIGGSTASGPYPPDAFAGGFVGTNEEYDTSTDTWTYKTSMPTPRGYFATAAYQNKIYCIGGAVGFRVDERTGFYSYIESGVNEVYDTVTDTWEAKKPLPYAEMKLQAQVVNGKIYVVGGASTYVYDPENDSWTLKKQAPVSHPWPVVIDDKILVTGEFSTLWGSPEQKILVYDTQTDSWSEGTSSPTAVVDGAAGATTGVKAPQKVYVLGLIVEALLPTVINQVYDPKTDTWATATTMPANRSDFGVAVINDISYVIGGYLRSSRQVTPTAMNEQYTPIGYSVQPEIKVLTPINQLYNGSSVSLIFTVDEQVNWMGYSLDGQDNVTITGNATLAGLSSGLHNVTVYAKDEFENTGASETIIFSVDKEPEPFLTAIIAAASLATGAIVGAGLLVYFKKRKS
jgi:N-acetylneuraminic acid mutarotase